jgi:hypothetical protein
MRLQALRWSLGKANTWYRQQPWLMGSQLHSGRAINPLEMWQADTFDPPEIDRELVSAQAIGMNSMRVFPARAALAAGLCGISKTHRCVPCNR